MTDLGKIWKDTSEEEKQEYIKLYEEDKIRYEEEMEDYEEIY